MDYYTAMLSPSVQAAKQKYRRLGALNNEHLFLRVLDAEKPRIKAPANSVSGESLFPGS